MRMESVKMVGTDFKIHENSVQTCENRAFFGVNCREIETFKLDCRFMFGFVNTCNMLCIRLVVECVSLV